MQKNKITLKMSRSKDATKHIKLEMYRKIVIQSSRGGWVVEDTDIKNYLHSMLGLHLYGK